MCFASMNLGKGCLDEIIVKDDCSFVLSKEKYRGIANEVTSAQFIGN